MTLFDEVLEISDRLDKAFPRANPADDPESLVTVLVSDDEFDALTVKAREAAASKGADPQIQVATSYVLVGSVRWLPRSSARADYE